jgi:tetratricopeptide (TPR) repeat protein
MKPKKPRVKAQAVEPVGSRPARGRSVYAAAALALLTFLAYANSFSAGFVFDNAGLLLQDPRIRELTGENIRLIFQHTYWWPISEAGLYRPFTTLSYLFNYAVLGNAHQPAGYHVINFLLHLGNVFLVYALTRRFLREFWPAFFAAALWAVHPVLTESVTNMIGRSDLLAALAVLSGFLMYLKSTESAGARRFAWLAGLAAVTAVGVFSKESGVVIVGVIALYELTWWKERKPGRSLLLGCIATLLPIAVMLYQRASVLAAAQPPELLFIDNPIVGAGFWRGRLTALQVIARYLGLVLWPVRLSSDYSYAQILLVHGSWQNWGACLAVLAAVVLVAALYRWNCTAFFLAGFAAITFAPMSNLLFPIGAIMAERFLYMPTIGLLACLVMAVYAAGRKIQYFAPVALCVIIAACAIRTWVRNRDWQDDRTLAEAIVRASPNSFKGHRLLALALIPTGEPGPNLERAIAEIETAVAILNSLPDAHNTPEVFRVAGEFYLMKGDAWRERDASQSSQAYERALQLLQRSIAIDRSERAQYDREGGAEWARRHSQMAASAKGDPDAYWMRVAAYLRLGNTLAASAAADQALALHPLNPEGYRQISYAFVAQHRIEDAAVALIEGALITSNPRLRSDLVDFYQRVFSESCAIKPGPDGPELNAACAMVHQQFCTASVEVVKSTWAFHGLDAAEQQKQDFVNKHGCPAGPLEQALPPYLAKTR